MRDLSARRFGTTRGVVASLAAIVVASCASSPAVDQQSGHELELAVGQPRAVPSAGLTVTVEAVEDSRCPVGVECVWAGDATVTLLVTADGSAPATYKLQLNQDSRRSVDHGPFRIRLVAVAPFPTADRKPTRDEYRATLGIHRK